MNESKNVYRFIDLAKRIEIVKRDIFAMQEIPNDELVRITKSIKAFLNFNTFKYCRGW